MTLFVKNLLICFFIAAFAANASAQDDAFKLKVPSLFFTKAKAPSFEFERSIHPTRKLTLMSDRELQSVLAQKSLAATSNDAELSRVTSVYRETSVFWYSAGAQAFTSLGVRALLGVPTLFIIFSEFLPSLGLVGPAALVVVGATLLLTTLVDSSISAFIGTRFFNSMSRFYEGKYLSAFIGQLGGNALSASVFWLTFGFGAMATTGVGNLAALIGTPAVTAFTLFTTLAAMPAVVISFIASLALPAMVSSYMLARGAGVKEGYKIDPTWKPLRRRVTSWDRPAPERYDDVFVSERLTIAIPGT